MALTTDADGICVGAATPLFLTVAPQRDYPELGMSPGGQSLAVVPTGVF